MRWSCQCQLTSLLSAAAAQVGSQVRSCEIFGGWCGTMILFLQVFRSPIPGNSTSGTKGLLVASIPSNSVLLNSTQSKSLWCLCILGWNPGYVHSTPYDRAKLSKLPEIRTASFSPALRSLKCVHMSKFLYKLAHVPCKILDTERDDAGEEQEKSSTSCHV
jgi:hypothetical protein